MKVWELIQILEGYPQELEVILEEWSGCPVNEKSIKEEEEFLYLCSGGT